MASEVDPETMKRVMQATAEAERLRQFSIAQGQRMANVIMVLVNSFQVNPDNGLTTLINCAAGFAVAFGVSKEVLQASIGTAYDDQVKAREAMAAAQAVSQNGAAGGEGKIIPAN